MNKRQRVRALNERSDQFEFDRLQHIRRDRLGLKRLASTTPFGTRCTFDGYAYHVGGRCELQLNIAGDIGTIVEVFESPGEAGSGGWLDIDGRRIPLVVDVLSVLTLGYAVTVHKSQGSQWPVCIVMLPRSAMHMAERALLYTAATRASEKLFLCGDVDLLKRSARNSPTTTGRQCNLTHLLKADEAHDVRERDLLPA